MLPIVPVLGRVVKTPLLFIPIILNLLKDVLPRVAEESAMPALGSLPDF